MITVSRTFNSVTCYTMSKLHSIGVQCVTSERFEITGCRHNFLLVFCFSLLSFVLAVTSGRATMVCHSFCFQILYALLSHYSLQVFQTTQLTQLSLQLSQQAFTESCKLRIYTSIVFVFIYTLCVIDSTTIKQSTSLQLF